MKNFNIIYKINAINTIINSNPKIIEKIYILKKNEKTKLIEKKCKEKHIKTYYIKKIRQKNLSYIKNTFYVIAKIKEQPNFDINDIIKKYNTTIKILILDRLQDPYNLASCIRTAEAFNINLIIISKKHTAKLTSLINSSSNGASLLIPIIIKNNIKNIIKKLKANNIKIVGFSAKATESLDTVILTPPIAIIMGSEKNGIKNTIQNKCNNILKITMKGKCKSINVSVATGIILSKLKI